MQMRWASPVSQTLAINQQSAPYNSLINCNPHTRDNQSPRLASQAYKPQTNRLMKHIPYQNVQALVPELHRPAVKCAVSAGSIDVRGSPETRDKRSDHACRACGVSMCVSMCTYMPVLSSDCISYAVCVCPLLGRLGVFSSFIVEMHNMHTYR